ncbi:MAG: response regulator [Caldilineaceae bacterium]|nr:response regulator [Caldilineaceae bacterium]
MILVVEDEVGLRDVLAEILEITDIPALCVASGEEGVAMYEQSQTQIEAVFLDVQLPGMGGKATFNALRTINPTLPVVLMSGRPEHLVMAEFDGEEHLSYLEKPFTLETIIAKVDTVLNVA